MRHLTLIVSNPAPTGSPGHISDDSHSVYPSSWSEPSDYRDPSDLSFFIELAARVDRRAFYCSDITRALYQDEASDEALAVLWVAVRRAVPWMVERALYLWEHHDCGKASDIVELLSDIRLWFDMTIEAPWDRLTKIYAVYEDWELQLRVKEDFQAQQEKFKCLWRHGMAAVPTS